MIRTRGYTLLEIIVAGVLATILVALSVQWIIGLATATSRSIQVGNGRELTFAFDRVEDDLRRAVHCDPYGLDSPVKGITAESLTLLVDDDKDGKVDQVSWRLNGGVLERGVSKSDNCNFIDPSWDPLATELKQETAFRPMRDGVARDNEYGGCADQSVLRCQMTALELKLEKADGTSRLTRVLRVPQN